MKTVVCFVFHDLVTECTLWEDTRFDTFLKFYKSTQMLNIDVIYSFDDGYNSLFKLYEEGHITDFSDFWIFPVNDLVGKKGYCTWEDIKVLASLGCRVGSHTLDHVDMLTLDEKDLLNNLANSKIEFEQILGIKNLYLAAPYGRTNATAYKIASKAGFCGVFSSRPGFFNKEGYRLNRVSLNENTINSFSARFFKSYTFAILLEIFRHEVIQFMKLVFGRSLYMRIRNSRISKQSW